MSEKSPAFQWYPRDILSSARVQEMSLAEEGAYRRLLDYCWLNETIPNDPTRCAKLIGKGCTVKIAKVALEMFTVHPSNSALMIHDRLELEREKQRSNREKRKQAADARWAREQRNDDANVATMPMQEQCKPDAFALQSTCLASSSSSSSSIPSPVVESVKESRSKKQHVACSDGDVFEVFDYWRQVHGHPQARFDEKRKKLISKRLSERPKADLKLAVDGCKKSPHHQGQTNGTIYDSIGLIFRDNDHVEMFMHIATGEGLVEIAPKRFQTETEKLTANDALYASYGAN